MATVSTQLGRTFTLSEAEKESGITAHMLQWRISHGKLKAEKVDGEWRISAEDLAAQPPPSKSSEKRKGEPKRSYNRKPKGDSLSEPEEKFERKIAYVFGRIEKELEIYAASIGVPAPVVTNRVGALLQEQTSG